MGRSGARARPRQGGLRPVVVLSEDVFNARSGTVIAMAITSQPQRAGFPLTLEVASVKISDDELSRLLEGLNEILGAAQASDDSE